MTTIGAMFGDVFKSLFKKPATEKYPFERKPDPERLRGKLFWNAEKCTGCQMCVRDCPANALELIVIDRASKKFVMKYHAERCTFCNQCVFSCKFGCLNLSHEDWELASLQQEPMTISYGREEDIKFLLEKAAQPDNPETEKECK
jgi:NAD(P)H-quinone oxidoreductase subunit I